VCDPFPSNAVLTVASKQLLAYALEGRGAIFPGYFPPAYAFTRKGFTATSAQGRGSLRSLALLKNQKNQLYLQKSSSHLSSSLAPWRGTKRTSPNLLRILENNSRQIWREKRKIFPEISLNNTGKNFLNFEQNLLLSCLL